VCTQSQYFERITYKMTKPSQVVFGDKYPPIILASVSPRRKELLNALGLNFKVVAPNFDEKIAADHTLPPEKYAMKLSQAKGLVVAKDHPDSLVIAADTIVVLEGEILEKPVDENDAITMLQKLQGTKHTVVTAVSVYYNGKNCCHYNETDVWLIPLNIETIAKYLQTGEPMDKAGSYALQGRASCFIQRIEGCYSNVIGLSLPLLRVLMREIR